MAVRSTELRHWRRRHHHHKFVPAGGLQRRTAIRRGPTTPRLFALDRVHELRISIDAATFRAMREDLKSVLPIGGIPAGLPGGPPARAGAACLGGPAGKGGGLTLRDPCYFPVTVTHDGHAWTQVGMRYKGNFSLMMGSLFALIGNAGRQAVVPPQLRPVRGRPSGDRQPAVLRFQGTDVLLELRRRLANARGVGQRTLSRSRGRCPTCRLLPHRREHRRPRRGLGPVHAGRGSGRFCDAHLAVRRSVGQPVQARRVGADWTTFDRAGFEKKTNKVKADFSDIQAAIEALHADLPPAAWRANLERHFDVDLFLRWLAVNQVVDNWDAYGRFAHNYYVYADPGRNGRLVWIPWDNNYAFGLIPFAANLGGMAQIAQRGAGAGPAPQVPVPQGPVPAGVPMLGSNGDVLFEKGVGQGWPLISRLLADPIYMPRYRAHLRFALGGLYERDRLAARIREWQTLLASSVKSDKPASMFGATEDFQTAIATLLTAVDRRRSLIEAALGR